MKAGAVTLFDHLITRLLDMSRFDQPLLYWQCAKQNSNESNSLPDFFTSEVLINLVVDIQLTMCKTKSNGLDLEVPSSKLELK